VFILGGPEGKAGVFSWILGNYLPMCLKLSWGEGSTRGSWYSKSNGQLGVEGNRGCGPGIGPLKLGLRGSGRIILVQYLLAWIWSLEQREK
jgi:hypothetical protein